MIMMKSLFKKENHGRHFRYLFCSSENNDFILRDIFIWTVCFQFGADTKRAAGSVYLAAGLKWDS